MNRILPLLLLAVVFAMQLSCDRQDDAPKEWGVELERGYAESRDDELAAFLSDWLKHSSPAPAELVDRKPNFEQAVYRLYQGFFQPAEFYDDTEFVVIQDKINVYIVDSDLRDLEKSKSWEWEVAVRKRPVISHLEVRQFRPTVTLPKQKILYLQEDYLVPLLGFLTQKNGHAMLTSYGAEECASEERKKRLKYLNSHLKIVPGHWNRGWHFETHPHIFALYFSADLKQAVLSYREYYGGGNAIMRATESGQWKVVAKESSWVE